MTDQQIVNANCVDWMRQQEANSIAAVVTDPPYGLEFMSSEWDTFAVRLPREVLNFRRFSHLTTVEKMRRVDVTDKKQLELLVYQEWTRQWALEAIRILKPGAYMLVMGGTRTHHRLMAGLEDAGFIIRDCLCWVYASGFPKNYDISKGFDKKAGAKRKVLGISSTDRPKSQVKSGKAFDRAFDVGQEHEPILITEPATDLAKQRQGWGTALKPAWEPIVLTQKPLEGTYCENVEKWGTGALNIDGCRVSTLPRPTGTKPTSDKPTGTGTSLLGSSKNRQAEYDQQLRKSIPRRDLTKQRSYSKGQVPGSEGDAWEGDPKGRFPANVQVDSEPDEFLGNVHIAVVHKTGHITSLSQRKGGTSFITGQNPKIDRTDEPPQDGLLGAYTRFFIIPKATKSERGEANKHPTVKPIRLFKQMIKLITPPGGTVLDPFLGSGTACLAAAELDIDCIGTEANKDYYDIAQGRLEAWRHG